MVLDACRTDTLTQIVADRHFYSEVNSYLSVASHSTGWLETYQSNLAHPSNGYISANPHTYQNLFPSDCVEVWRTHWDDDIGTVRAEDMTDIAVSYFENNSPDRLVVHYMQPHFPSVPQPDLGVGLNIDGIVGNAEPGWEGSVWKLLKKGRIKVETVREAYEENLRYVLDEVDVLADNLTSQNIAVNADHRNMFDPSYGHPSGSVDPSVRRVPWCEVSEPDSAPRKAEYASVRDKSGSDVDVEERLSALGYQ